MSEADIPSMGVGVGACPITATENAAITGNFVNGMQHASAWRSSCGWPCWCDKGPELATVEGLTADVPAISTFELVFSER